MSQQDGVFPEDLKQALAELPVRKLLVLVEAAARRDPVIRELALCAITNGGGDGKDGVSSNQHLPRSLYQAPPRNESGTDLQAQLPQGVRSSASSPSATNGGNSPSDSPTAMLRQQLLQAQITTDDNYTAQLLGITQAPTQQLQGLGNGHSLGQQQQQTLFALQQQMSSSVTSHVLGTALLDVCHSAQQQQQQDPASTDEFRMYFHKAVPCSLKHSHSWSVCPYSHPGENARRRDPRRFKYVAVSCPYNKAGACTLGENCPYAHGVFEVNLHPARYRTETCRDSTTCTRSVCFFAHNMWELRQPLLDWCPTPEEFAAVEGTRAQRVKATLPQNHALQGMIDSAMSNALSQLRLQSSGSSAQASAMEALTAGQAVLLSAGRQQYGGGHLSPPSSSAC